MHDAVTITSAGCARQAAPARVQLARDELQYDRSSANLAPSTAAYLISSRGDRLAAVAGHDLVQDELVDLLRSPAGRVPSQKPKFTMLGCLLIQ